MGNKYKFFLNSSIFIVFALIFVGGLVRSTGSGMGCPDWPKCFGSYIPPTKESQLPSNYKEIYKEHLDINEPFNAFKTWTEYLNRLLGALTGIVVLGLAITSFSQFKKNKWITVFSFLALTMVFITALVGAKVVSSNLNTGKINIHLILAFFLVFSLITSAFQYNRMEAVIPTKGQNLIKIFVVLCFLILVFQVFTGMNVRTEIEEIQFNRDLTPRSQWVENAIHNFPTHRVFSIILSILTGFILFKSFKLGKFAGGFNRAHLYLGISVLGQMLTGTLLFKFGFPANAQPFHLLFASIMLGSLFYMVLFLLAGKVKTNY